MDPRLETPGPPSQDEYEDVELTPATFHVMKTSTAIVESLVKKLDTVKTLVGELRKPHNSILEYEPLPTVNPLPGVAIDSTFPIDGGLELIGGRLVAVIAGYTCFSNARINGMPCKNFYAKAWLVESEEQHKQVPLAAKSLEKALSLKLLERIGDARILLLDGEIVPYQLLFKSEKSIRKSRLLSSLDMRSCQMLREAARKGVVVAGIVKRSYSKLLSAKLGRLAPLNDKGLLTLALRQGYYTILGSFNELLPSYASLIESREGSSKLKSIVEERLSTCPEYGDIIVAFYKPHKPPKTAYAVKAEMFIPRSSGIDAGEILGVLNQLTNPATGLPYPVDLVDEYIRMEARILELLRRRVVRVLASMREALPLDMLKLLAHTNPEKRYVYEPRGASRG